MAAFPLCGGGRLQQCKGPPPRDPGASTPIVPFQLHFRYYPAIRIPLGGAEEPRSTTAWGIPGALAGLEVIRAFNENEIETDHPIEVIDWTNGEGARFAPAMPGSGAIAGTLDKEMVITCRDREGWIFSDELDALGLTKHKRKT